MPHPAPIMATCEACDRTYDSLRAGRVIRGMVLCDRCARRQLADFRRQDRARDAARAYLAEIGRRGGLVKSEAKAAASRANGRLSVKAATIGGEGLRAALGHAGAKKTISPGK